MPELRKRVQKLYFIECIGWFFFYMREYYKSKTEEDRNRNKMSMMKYVLDGLVAHNELASKLFNLEPTTTALLSLASGSLNLYLVWKWYCTYLLIFANCFSILFSTLNLILMLSCHDIIWMNKLTALAEVLKNTAVNHPYLAGTAALFSLTILILRKVHYRFVVYPGKYKYIQRWEEGLIAAIWEDTAIQGSKTWILRIYKLFLREMLPYEAGTSNITHLKPSLSTTTKMQEVLIALDRHRRQIVFYKGIDEESQYQYSHCGLSRILR